MTQRDDFTKEIAKTLGERVGLLCSNADCRASTKAPHTDDRKSVSVGIAAHICAAAPGGPRYDPKQTPEQRASIENGIWLCATCATRIDKDTPQFPTSLLLEWRRKAEEEASARLGRPHGAVRGAVQNKREAILDIMAKTRTLIGDALRGAAPGRAVGQLDAAIKAVDGYFFLLRDYEVLFSREEAALLAGFGLALQEGQRLMGRGERVRAFHLAEDARQRVVEFFRPEFDGAAIS
jgi:hypothetical protein